MSVPAMQCTDVTARNGIAKPSLLHADAFHPGNALTALMREV